MLPAYAGYRPVEGGFWNGPACNVLAGPGALTAGPDGVVVGRFGWADPDTGRVSNVLIADVTPGIVLPTCGPWTKLYHDRTRGGYVLREGYGVTLINKGSVWARFAGGATASQRVYASPLDGTCQSGYSVDREQTGFSVVSSCAPGELARISTWSNF